MFLNLKILNNIFQNKLINFEKVFKVDLWIFENDNEKNTQRVASNIFTLIIDFLWTVYSSIFTKPEIVFSTNNKSSIFFVRTFLRPDLNKHSGYYESVDDTTVCIFHRRSKKIDILTFFVCIFFLIKFNRSWLKPLKNYKINLFSKAGFKIFLNLFGSLSDIIKIFPILTKHSKLVSFQEMVLGENLICQIANALDIKTFALQHGLGIYNENGSYESRSPVYSYLGSVCKNILCWGNFNKEIYTKHSKANILLVGKADLPNEKIVPNGVTIIFESRMCTLANKELLLLSEKLIEKGVSVSRWFKIGHNLINNIEGRDGPLRKTVIGVNSSLIVELGFLGCNVFVTKESNLKNKIPSNLIFEDIDIFLKNLINTDKYPHHIWKYFIDCTDLESVRRYKKILNI